MVAEKFIQNVKVLTDRRSFSEDDLKLLMVCIQELATLSPIELVSLLDNIDVLVLEGQREISEEEMSQTRSELFDTMDVETTENL